MNKYTFKLLQIMPLTEEQKKRKREYNKKWRESNKEYNKKWRESNKEYHKKWYDSNKDKIKGYYQAHKNKIKDYYQAYKNKISEVQRKYKENNPEKFHKTHTISHWKHQGLIDDDYEKIYNKVMNTDYCERCNCKLTGGKPPTNTTKCMDHNHETGKFRNVLCLSCNSSLPKQTKKIKNNINKNEI